MFRNVILVTVTNLQSVPADGPYMTLTLAYVSFLS